MFKNKAFARQAIIFMVLGVMYFFTFSGLQTDHMNILTPYLLEHRGWTDLQITNPATLASIIATFVYILAGTAFTKLGLKRVFIACLLIMGVSTAGIALAGDNYMMYAISLFTLRLFVVPMQFGAYSLCANWFIKYRGRVMGIITIGSPLFSIAGIGILTALVASLGLNAYLVISVFLALLAFLTFFGPASKPEDMGLFPDGSETAPISEVDDIEEVSFKEFITDIKAWKIMAVFGTLQFIIICMMTYMAVRYISLSTPDQVPNLFVSHALKWLSIGAACGIPMSFVLGWVDDKLGTIRAAIVLTFLYLFAVVPLMIMPVGGSEVLMAIWAFGVACMTGGMPTLDPCITSYVYGRKKSIAINKWRFAVQSIPSAFALTFMGYFNQTGRLTMAYVVLLCLLIIPFVVLLSMRDMKDANEADRDYIKK
ncbi:MAG: MFS transporter [Lachnospirales bacterium]